MSGLTHTIIYISQLSALYRGPRLPVSLAITIQCGPNVLILLYLRRTPDSGLQPVRYKLSDFGKKTAKLGELILRTRSHEQPNIRVHFCIL
jgi:hypothetical protein